MRLKKIAPFLMMIPLLGCQSGQENDSFCQIAKPIYLDKQDKISGDTARQILIYDDQGAIRCGWPHAAK